MASIGQGPRISMLVKLTPTVAQPDTHKALVGVAHSYTNLRQVRNSMLCKYTPRAAKRGTNTALVRASRAYTNAWQVQAEGRTIQCSKIHAKCSTSVTHIRPYICSARVELGTTLKAISTTTHTRTRTTLARVIRPNSTHRIHTFREALEPVTPTHTVLIWAIHSLPINSTRRVDTTV